MTDNAWTCATILALAVLWAGSTIVGSWTKMKTSIAQAEYRAKETQIQFDTLLEANRIANEVNRQALLRGIERLAERGRTAGNLREE